jgi:type II secretory ATPase GspE/PulE/Tfp pilus assembly ATPase PilB-like protein
LEINPKVISSAVNIAIAQRLVRKLCDECKKKVPLNEKKREIVKNILNSIVDKKNIPRDFSSIWEARGCNKCNQTGYKGRIGIFEAIIMDKDIEGLVKKSASEGEISDVAKKQGVLTIIQDGILKAIRGLTSLDELERVVGL